jgi:ribonuclease D
VLPVPYLNITTDHDLVQYCERLHSAKQIAFDTEFVAEQTYRPVLCLVQVNADGELAMIDAMVVRDMTPFWEAVVADGHEIVVHAGRGELEFCFHSVGRLPSQVFDVQLAAGLIGIEYPAGFGSLLSKILGQTHNKEETRTDWRRRPLSSRQIEYALDDIRLLLAMRESLHTRLGELGRLAWLDEEMTHWKEEIEKALSQERWRRISGNSGLSRRSLAIIRELWRWREAEAERRDCPVRRVLRDDLIVELARRQTADVKRILAVRGLERGDLKNQLPKMAEAIQRGLELAEQECPTSARHDHQPQLSVLGQFLFAALGSICRQKELAPSLVGTPNDIRSLITYRTGQTPDRRPPRLAEGWRAEVVGQVIDDLMAGKLAIRIVDPESDSPLAFDRREP